jgi:cation transport regulator
MPYSSTQELPDPIKKHLPQHAQSIFKEAFNSAFHEYEDTDETRAFKIAWGAVKRQYRKVNGKWVRIRRDARTH